MLAYSGVSDHDAVIGMLRAGASGYVVRDAPPEKLAAALRGAARGDSSSTTWTAAACIHELLDQVRDTNRAREERARKRARIRSVMLNGSSTSSSSRSSSWRPREVVGHEALSRFAGHPTRGPDAVVRGGARASGSGMSSSCGGADGLRALARLPDGTFMAVNVSPVTAERPELLALLVCAHVDHVVLEVTEHAPVEDYPRFRIAIGRMRELGARLAIDDAGAGFASLRHILELDAELIKLDGSLTHSLEADPRRRSLASALIEFGRESGAAVLAEHIESELQLHELRRLGVLRPGLPPGPPGAAARACGVGLAARCAPPPPSPPPPPPPSPPQPPLASKPASMPWKPPK